MALDDNDFAKLMEMQRLCHQVEADNQRLRQLAELLESSRNASLALQELYENDWLRITETDEPSEAQNQQLQAQPDQPKYSVLSEDGIWNELTEQYQLRLSILKWAANTI